MAHPHRYLDSMGRERVGPLRPHHFKVVADHSEGDAQDTKLVALRLKFPPCLGEVHGQPDRDALGLQLLGSHVFELDLEGANLLLCVVALLEGLVALLMSHAML